MSHRIVIGLSCVVVACVGDAAVLPPLVTDSGASPDSAAADTSAPPQEAGGDAATGPSFAWVRQFGSAGAEHAGGIAIDAQGGIYMGGFMSATLTAGNVTLNNVGKDGQNDGFLLKLASDGTASSGKVIGGPGTQNVASVALDQMSHLFLNVGFNGATTLDSTPIAADPDQQYDFLIAKYDAATINFQVATPAVGPGIQTAWTFAPLTEGVVVCGSNNGTAKNFLGSDLVASSPGKADLLVAKLFTKSDYKVQYVTKQTDSFCSVGADANDNYVVGGSLRAPVDFGLGAVTPTNSGQSSDDFIVKFSPTNTALWNTVMWAGGGSSGDLDFVSSTPNGEVYGGGSLTGSWSSQTTPLLQSNVVAGPIYKLAANGSYIWSKVVAGMFWQSYATDKIGRLAVCGVLNADTDLGTGPIKAQGGGDVLLAVYSANGDVLYANAFGDNSPQSCSQVAFTPNGDVLIAGSFQGTLNMGSAKLTTMGSNDIFLARLTMP